MDSALHSNQIMGPFTLAKKKKKKDHARLRLGVEYCFYLFYLGYLWRVACIPLHIICHLEIWLTKDMFGAMTASAF